MPMTLHFLDEDGKYLDTHVITSDKERSMEEHKSVYNLPTGYYTKIKPIKECEGYDRYFVNGKWEYREIIPEPVEEEDAE